MDRGDIVTPLVGPLRCAIDVVDTSVRIDGPKPPSAVTAEDLAEDAKREFDSDSDSDSDTDDD